MLLANGRPWSKRAAVPRCWALCTEGLKLPAHGELDRQARERQVRRARARPDPLDANYRARAMSGRPRQVAAVSAVVHTTGCAPPLPYNLLRLPGGVKRIMSVGHLVGYRARSAGVGLFVPEPTRDLMCQRRPSSLTCDDARNADRLHEINETKMRLEALQIAQASLLRERFRWSTKWSGTGSNCRPSAFQEVYHPESTHLGKTPTAQLTRIYAAERLFSVLLTRITSVLKCAVSSVGFLWGSAAASLSCGGSVGLAEALN
jgi:hypothetical protein